MQAFIKIWMERLKGWRKALESRENDMRKRRENWGEKKLHKIVFFMADQYKLSKNLAFESTRCT